MTDLPASSPPQLTRGQARAKHLRHAIQDVAQAFESLGASVEIHPSVVGSHPSLTLLTYALVGLLAAGFVVLKPLWGLVLLFALVPSAIRDIDGGMGWLRRFTPKEIGRSLVIWPCQTPKQQPKLGWPTAKPAPENPTILICLPISTQPPRSVWWAAFLPVAAWILILVGMTCQSLLMELGDQLVGAGCLGFAITATGAIGTYLTLDHPKSLGPAETVAALLTRRLRDSKPLPNNLRVAIALQSGHPNHPDGIESLLKNNEHRFPKGNTTIIGWKPSTRALTRINPEGWVRSLPSNAGANRMLEPFIPREQKGTTLARRALELEWRAIGVEGGFDDPQAVADVLAQAILPRDTKAS